MSASPLDRLAREIVAIKRQVQGLSAPQLALSTVPLTDGTEMGVVEGVEKAIVAEAVAGEASAAAAEAAAAADEAALAAEAAHTAATDAQATAASAATTAANAQSAATAAGTTASEAASDADAAVAQANTAAQQAAAAQTAAGTATTTANTAKSTADTATTKVAALASQGTDLITNGTGSLRDNTNFATYFTFNGADAPVGANGSFVEKFGTAGGKVTDESQPYDPNKQLRLSFQCRQTVAGATNTMYGFLAPYDQADQSIAPSHYMRVAGTETTLAADLKPGDTTIKLTNGAGWYGSAAKPVPSNYTFLRSIQFWDYVDSAGKAWPAYTYTRNVLASDLYAEGGLDPATGIITLRAPYSGATRPAGTPVSQPTSGGSYIYMPSATNAAVPETWKSYADTHPGGIMPAANQAVALTGATSWTTGMPPGTARVRVGWLLNYPSGGGRHAVAAVSLSDAAAAQATATAVDTLTSGWKKIGSVLIDGGKIFADSIGAGAIAADAILARHIKAGEITAAKLVAGTLTSASGVFGDISAASITSGVLNAARIASGSIATAHLAAGAVIAEKIAAGAIIAEKLAAGSVIAEKIAAGAVVADKIAARAITADKIELGSVGPEQIARGTLGTNLVPDPSFEEDYAIEADFLPSTRPDRWRIVSSGTTSGAFAATRDLFPRSGAKCLRLSVSTADSINTHVQVMSGVFPVTPGKTYTVSANAGKRDASGASRFYMRIAGGSTTALTEKPGDSTANAIPFLGEDPLFAEDKDLAYTGATHSPDLYDNFTGEFTVPAGITYAAIRFFNWKPAGGSTIIVDDVSVLEKGTGASELTSAGLRLFDGTGTEAGAFVSNRPNRFSVSSGGQTLAGISDTGAGTFQTLDIAGSSSVEGGDIDTGFRIYGTEFLDWLNDMPRGIMAWENFVNDTTGLTAETGYGEVGFTALPGRLYRVNVRGMVEPDAQAESLVMRLRMSYADAPASAPSPTTTSPVMLQTNVVAGAANGIADADFWYSDWALIYNETSTPRNVRILHTMDAGGTAVPVMRSQGGGLSNFSSPETGTCLSVEDVGPYRSQGGAYNTGGAAVAPVQTYTKTWTSTDACCYMGSGAKDSSQGSSDMKQGYSSYDGDSKSLWTFPSMTSTLSGATITKIRVYLYANHWYYNSGGTARIKVHGYSSIPGSSPSMTTAVDSSSWPKPGGRWVTLPSSLHAGFISGAYKGIGVGPAGSTNQLYYGRFNKAGAKIEVTYKK